MEEKVVISRAEYERLLDNSNRVYDITRQLESAIKLLKSKDNKIRGLKFSLLRLMYGNNPPKSMGEKMDISACFGISIEEQDSYISSTI